MYITVKGFGLLQPHFGHLSCIPFVCMTYKVQGMLSNSNQSVVEKLPSFVKLYMLQPDFKPLTGL